MPTAKYQRENMGKAKITSKNKDTICTFPWEMYSIDTGFGWYRSCPRIPYQKLEDLDFHNHDKIVDLRQGLRDGVKHDLCKDCWYAEDNGAKSYKQVLKTNYAYKNSDQDYVAHPRILEVKFSNLCNLRCIFCSSKCSSLWEDEQPITEDMLGSKKGAEVNTALLKYINENYKNLEMFQLFGGEPVLHKEFNDIFDIILKKPESDGQKEISFSTNLYYNDTYRKKFEDNIKGCLDKGHKIYMRMSIDGVYDQGKYLRQGIDWSVFEKNLDSFMDKFHDWPNFGRLRCNIALNATNIMYLDTIMHYLNDRGLDNVEPHYNYVSNPKYFYVQTYGTRLQQAIDIIKSQDYRIYDKYKTHVLDLLGSMVHLEPQTDVIKQGKDWLNTYDIKTNQNFLEVFPLNRYMFDDRL